MIGAFLSNSLIGICGFTRMKRKKTNHIGEISQLYIKPEFSGKGIATGLMKSAIDEAFKIKGLEKIILAAVESNSAAQKLYQKFNFVEYGRLENYFKVKGKYQTQVFLSFTKSVNEPH